MNGLIDTSVFIAKEEGRPLGELPDRWFVSVLTIAELHAGVLATDDHFIRMKRMRTLGAVENALEAIAIDAYVARAFAEIKESMRQMGRRAPPTIDALIAATGVTYNLPVYTQDREFREMPLVEVVLV